MNKELKSYKLENTIKREGIKILELNKKDIKLLKSCKHAVSKEEVRPILQYICIDKDNFVSLDGYRLALRKHNLKINNEILIHSEILKLTKLEKIEIYKNDDNLYYIINDDLCYSNKQYNGKYINYKSLIPELNDTYITVNKKQLTDILKIKTIDNILKLIINKNSLHIENSINELGELNISNNNIDIVIGINKKYLKQAISKTKDKEIKIYFDTPVRPIIIGNINYIDLILPIRLIK